MSTDKKMIADKLVQIEENVEKVYNAGKKAEYDAFWDAFQNYGNQINGKYIYAGRGWTVDTFKPKYSVAYESSTNIFQEFGNGKKCDLAEILEKQGVVFDFSKCRNLSTGFYGTSFTRIPKIDMSCSGAGENSVTTIFSNSKVLETIDEFILRDDGIQLLTNAFNECNALKNIKFGGVIGQNLDMHWSPLTADSIRSIMEHLSDTSSGKTLTLSKTAVETAIANGGFGGDTVYFSTDREFMGSYLLSNPISLSAGQTIKIEAEWDRENHNIDNYSTWWFESTGDDDINSDTYNYYGTPGYTLPRYYTAQTDEQRVYGWYFYSDITEHGGVNVPIKIRAVLVDENGNEINGENLHSFATKTAVNGGTLTITEESWETLVASKPNWTISLQ